MAGSQAGHGEVGGDGTNRPTSMGRCFVYILASKRNGTLYVGMAQNLARRIHEHREGLVEGFSKRYGVKMLVYVEEFATVPEAIQRETSLKRWKRQWKLELIEKHNPQWRDLYEDGL